jgi:hypothetical protein
MLIYATDYNVPASLKSEQNLCFKRAREVFDFGFFPHLSVRGCCFFIYWQKNKRERADSEITINWV